MITLDGAHVVARLRDELIRVVGQGAKFGAQHPEAVGLVKAIAMIVHDDDERVKNLSDMLMRSVTRLHLQIVDGIPDEHGVMPPELFRDSLPYGVRELLYADKAT